MAEAIEHASPVLAEGVRTVCAMRYPEPRQARRTVLSVARYLLRMTGRATPFGLFAGVAAASVGPELRLAWGSGHQAVARVDASWLAAVIAQLESCPQLVSRLPLVLNNLCFVRGRRLIVPQGRSQETDHGGVAEISMRYTAAVQAAVEAARSPIRGEDLATKLAAEFPDAPSSVIEGLLNELVKQGVLLSGLHAPSTTIDAFSHLLEQLEIVGAGDVPQMAGLLSRLREIRAGLDHHNGDAAESPRHIRTAIARLMTALNDHARQPLAVDVRLDCRLVLPRQIADEAEVAASALARLTASPFGTAAWQSYATRFFERYGTGALVPVLDLVDPDIGLGFPAGYLGSTAQTLRVKVSAREERLLELAQAAALDGRQEIVLNDRLVDELSAGDLTQAQPTPHLELCFRLQAASKAALERGEFHLAIVSVSRGVGTLTGRFIGLLKRPDQQRLAATFAHVQANDPETLPVQLSFPPLAEKAAQVTRAPVLLPTLIRLGEHHNPDDGTIRLDDLAVGCDGRRLYLASLSSRRRLEPVIPHALDLRAHTPPLARFLAEVGRAQNAVVTGFDWGVASRLPFLPRIRYGRIVLSPARWLLGSGELPGRDASFAQWEQAVTEWCARRRVPNRVYLTEGDRRLRLDLKQEGHLALLRTHVDQAQSTVLTEAPEPGADGWFDGHAHEIVVSMVASRARWPPPPKVSAARLISRDHGHLPGTSRWLYAKLYGHLDRQAEVLAEHLPALLAGWEEPPDWWFIRYRDPEWHLRLRIALPDAEQFGWATHHVSTWAADLRRQGLLRDLQFAAYYPETGRWGRGAAMAAAEEVFTADSRALVAQFAQRSQPHPQPLAAAHFVAIATAFMGSTAGGMRWLIKHAKVRASDPLPRHLLVEAVRLADLADDWAALRATPGGEAIVQPWLPRHDALTRYRAHLTGVDGIASEAVLDSLLHVHHIRAVGIDRDDERTCLRLARAAALAWDARTNEGRA
ncbi:lantibiotic dehydratase [Sphaerisporangium album]|uniref:lantibiotic dehydratase n=1 Tax=Sphaerisporangium album TaxID=509200 RepID=UPI001C68F708|nr:lantibiotic dehydratase [Sphaerisporangium album]